jgi:hypothetical protein
MNIFDSGSGRTLYRKSYLGWVIHQPRPRGVSIPCVQVEKRIKKGKMGQKTGRNRPESVKIAQKLEKVPREISRFASPAKIEPPNLPRPACLEIDLSHHVTRHSSRLAKHSSLSSGQVSDARSLGPKWENELWVSVQKGLPAIPKWRVRPNTNRA